MCTWEKRQLQCAVTSAVKMFMLLLAKKLDMVCLRVMMPLTTTAATDGKGQGHDDACQSHGRARRSLKKNRAVCVVCVLGWSWRCMELERQQYDKKYFLMCLHIGHRVEAVFFLLKNIEFSLISSPSSSRRRTHRTKELSRCTVHQVLQMDIFAPDTLSSLAKQFRSSLNLSFNFFKRLNFYIMRLGYQARGWFRIVEMIWHRIPSWPCKTKLRTLNF